MCRGADLGQNASHYQGTLTPCWSDTVDVAGGTGTAGDDKSSRGGQEPGPERKEGLSWTQQSWDGVLGKGHSVDKGRRLDHAGLFVQWEKVPAWRMGAKVTWGHVEVRPAGRVSSMLGAL